jgi:transketolase C-terminal domain/subunit
MGVATPPTDYTRARVFLAEQIKRGEQNVTRLRSDLAGAQTTVDEIAHMLHDDEAWVASLRATLALLPADDEAVQS